MAIGRFGSGDGELERMREEFFNDRPTGINNGASEEWESLQAVWHNAREEGLEIESLDDLKRLGSEERKWS